MANAKAKSAMIPKFSGEAEEATWWDAHRSEIEAEIRRRMKQDKPLPLDNLLRGRKPSQPVTLRILKEDLETARRLAARRGVGYQTYIKMVLREALAERELHMDYLTEERRRSVEKVREYLLSYSDARQLEGITAADIVRDYKVSLSAVLDAFNWLEQQGHLQLTKSTGHADAGDSTRAFLAVRT